MKFPFVSLLTALSSISFALGDVYPPNAPDSLKNAYRSLGEMGLSLEKAGNVLIDGTYGVAVPHSAIIKENGKTFVVILNPNDASKSERVEVALGNRSRKLVHARNQVTPGDYVVVRKEPEVAESATRKQSKQENTSSSDSDVTRRNNSPQTPATAPSEYVFQPVPERVPERPTPERSIEPTFESPAFSLTEPPYPEVPYRNTSSEPYLEPTQPSGAEGRYCEICRTERYFEPEPEIYHPFPADDIRNTFENFGFGSYEPPFIEDRYIPEYDRYVREYDTEYVPEEDPGFRCNEGFFRRFLSRFD